MIQEVVVVMHCRMHARRGVARDGIEFIYMDGMLRVLMSGWHPGAIVQDHQAC